MNVIDTLPLWFWLPLVVVGWICLAFEVRAALRAFEQEKASDPVVVTASGRPSDRYVRACKTVGGVR